MTHCSFQQTGPSDVNLDCDNSQSVTGQPTEWYNGEIAHAAEWFAGLLLLLFVNSLFVKIANEWERAVVLRFGKFSHVAGPGLFFACPFVASVTEWVSMQLEVKEIKAEETLTKDTVPVNIRAVVTWQVTDPKVAVVDISDYEDSIERIAQVMLREVVGSCEFTQLLSNREEVDNRIRDSIARKIQGWGIEIKAVDIQDVKIPSELQEAMSREAQAERERHARIILGQSEVDIAKQLVDAAKIYEQDPVALRLRAMNIIYETTKEKGSTILIPTDMANIMGAVLPKTP
jgi:regulator of protease activity HflC (stomatin/prohibitin superfamily)